MRALLRPLHAALPPVTRGTVDYYLRPEKFRSMFGGALNGQKIRRQIMLDLLHAFDFGRIYETGTFYGSTTEFLAHHFEGPIVTVETNPYYHRFASLRLRPYPNVGVVHSDSVDHLRRLAQDPAETGAVSLFYLDAHWYEHLPLRDELTVILGAWRHAVIVVDDFEVPGDPGYAFDDYGPNKRLCLDYLRPLGPARMAVFFPTAPSEEETGAKRGCVVLAAEEAIADRLGGVRSLRRFDQPLAAD